MHSQATQELYDVAHYVLCTEDHRNEPCHSTAASEYKRTFEEFHLLVNQELVHLRQILQTGRAPRNRL